MNYRKKAMLMAGALLCLNLSIYSQSISLKMSNVSVKKAMTELQTKSGYSFVYIAGDVDTDRTVSINASQLKDAVAQILKGQNVSYEIQGKNIVIKKGSQQQVTSSEKKKKVTGTVKDSNGEPIIGATVVEKGTTNGTVTDFDGNYILELSDNGILAISYIGYKSQEYSVAKIKQGQLSVTLKEDTEVMDEVVVVGYGSQKKVNLSGSVSSVNFNEIAQVPVSNTTTMLQGRMPGVTIISGGSQPGKDEPTINIRGIGTLGNTKPMVIIDGMESSLSTVAPNDIESITVLKDAASASIYGVRAANGVILVTTKRGKNEKVSVSYAGNFALQQATVLPDYCDSWDWAKLYNETQGYEKYTAEMIQQMRDGTNPDKFANTDWAKEVFRTAFMHTHHLSIKGGTDKVSYMNSLEYLDQDGIMLGTSNQRLNFRANVDYNVNKFLKMGFNFAGGRDRIDEPYQGTGGGWGIMRKLYWFTRPTVPVKYSNGEWGAVDGNDGVGMPAIHNPVKATTIGNRYDENYRFDGKVFAEVSILRNLKFKTSFGAKYRSYFNSSFTPTDYFYDSEGNIVQEELINSASKYTKLAYSYLNENILTYDFNVKKHNFSFLLGHSIQYDRYDEHKGSIESFPNNEIYQLSAGSKNPSVSGKAVETSLQSLFARINYNWNNKYLVEGNIRRDQSSRLPSNNRVGVFPSASAAWRISEESFIKNNLSFVSNLKLRGSWGTLGNQEIDDYAYVQLVNTGQNYVFDNKVSGGVAVTSLANPNIKWETTTMTDIGLDLGLFNNHLEIVFDYFYKKTSDILLSLPINATLGNVGAPKQNAGEVENKGWELSATYHGNIGDFNYTVSGNLSKIKNKILDLKGLEWYSGKSIYREGIPIGSFYGYIADGLYRSQEEIDEGPKRFNGVDVAPGDIKYRDISGPDGVPDGQVDAQYDRTVIGSPFPKLTYGFNVFAQYKNFDFSLFLQGVSGINRFYTDAPSQGSNILTDWLDRYDPVENPQGNMPRMKGTQNNETSTFWIKDASYLRLKNVEIGYNLPKRLCNKLYSQGIRIYFTGLNLLTFTKVKHWDAEKFADDNENFNYPQSKSYSLGVNVTF